MNTTTFAQKGLMALASCGLLALAACGDGGSQPAPTPSNNDVVDNNAVDNNDVDNNDTTEQGLRPGFEIGQTWIVGSIYRSTAVKTPEDLIAAPSERANADLIEIEPLMPQAVVPSDSTNWTTPIFWEFGVINTDYTPEEGPFAELALDAEGNAQPITIIKAVAPKELNTRAVVDGMDPVFYLVLRQSDYKVTAVHYNYKVKSGRNTVVLELPEGESGTLTAGADVDYFIVDYMMPVFPMHVQDGKVAYGPQAAGLEMDVQVVDSDSAAVEFVNAVDKRPVRQQWSDGEPWFDWSITHGRRSWRLSPEQVMELLDIYGVEVVTNTQFLEPAEAINRKFRNRINLNQNFTVDAGEFAARTPASHSPWAGYWFPLQDSGTLFGWSGSGRSLLDDGPATSLRDKVDEDLGEIDTLMDEILEMDAGAEGRKEKVDDYWQKKRDVATRIREHFEDPEEGVIAKLADGRMTLEDVDNFGPLEKYSLYLLANKTSDRPFESAIWEFTKQYNPEGGSWWGKCNGWAAASILTAEPREPVTVQLDMANIVEPTEDGEAPAAVNMTFEPGDLKALAASLYYGTHSHFYGQRFYGEDDDRGANYQDILPDVFHRLITFYIGEEKFPMVFELTAGDQIWNYSCYAYDSTVGERVTLDEGTKGINRASKQELIEEGGLTEEAAKAIFDRSRGPRGAFAEWSEVTDLDEVEQAMVDKLEENGFSLFGERLAHQVTTDLDCATDGVAAGHVDSTEGEPTGFTKHYTYNLVVSDSGRMIGGEWTGGSIEEHPDFVWVPYANEERRSDSSEWRRYGNWDNYLDHIYWSRYAPSENPFLFTDVLDDLLEVRENAPVVCNAEPDDCGPGMRCNELDGTCEEVTEPDPDPEPTGECAGLAAPEALEALEGSEASGTVCAGRDSWFGLQLAEGQHLEAVVTFAHSEGDVDIALHDPQGAKLRSSTSTSDMESVLWTAETTGLYRLRVYGYAGAEAAVDLHVTITDGAPDGGDTNTCADEASEPNNNADSATALEPGTHEGAICGSDGDFYHVTAEGDWTVTLAFTHADGDLDLKATTAGGESLGVSQGTTDTETLSGTGEAFLQVYGYSGATGAYSITLE